MEERKCNVCGGAYVEDIANGYKCSSCQAVFVDSMKTDEEKILLASAHDELRRGEFDSSEERFLSILEKFPKSHEAYFGVLLSRHGIVFVNDTLENKKVPTCHNIIMTDVLSDPNLEKAIAYAPQAVADSYKLVAAKIERIRQEWLLKAAKEPPYDIFICFKDSDRENGIARTEDSVEAANLYVHLKGKGYHVFFSRESLRDKVAEQYEPYIFNALNTSKVMIVYGQKSEYIVSTWVKNEWSRYLKKISEGQKEPNSLIVAYEKMDDNELPKVLSQKQYMDAGKKTFYTDLELHIQKVLATEEAKKGIQKIEIKRGVVQKRAEVQAQRVTLRDFGEVNIKPLTVTEEGDLKVAEKLLQAGNFDVAIGFFQDLLNANPRNVRAEVGLYLAKTEMKSLDELTQNTNQFLRDVTLEFIESTIKNANVDVSKKVLEATAQAIYSLSSTNISPSKMSRLVDIIKDYDFSTRIKALNAALGYATINAEKELFETLMVAIGETDSSIHIEKRMELASAVLLSRNYSVAGTIADSVLELDNSYLEAHWTKLLVACKCDSDESLASNICDFNAYEILDNMLAFCDTGDNRNMLYFLCDSAVAAGAVAVFNQLIKRVTAKPLIKKYLHKMALSMLSQKEFSKALEYGQLLLTEDDKNIDAYLIMAMSRLEVTNESAINGSDEPLRDLPEYKSLLRLAANDDAFFKRIMDLDSRQRKAIEDRVLEREEKVRSAARAVAKKAEEKVRAVAVARERSAAVWAINREEIGRKLLIILVCAVFVGLAVWEIAFVATMYSKSANGEIYGLTPVNKFFMIVFCIAILIGCIICFICTISFANEGDTSVLIGGIIIAVVVGILMVWAMVGTTADIEKRYKKMFVTEETEHGYQISGFEEEDRFFLFWTVGSAIGENRFVFPSEYNGKAVTAITNVKGYRFTQQVVIPEGVTYVGGIPLSYKDIILPNTLRILGSSAFSGFPGDSIVLPPNVEKVGNFVFHNSWNRKGPVIVHGKNLNRIEFAEQWNVSFPNKDTPTKILAELCTNCTHY